MTSGGGCGVEGSSCVRRMCNCDLGLTLGFLRLVLGQYECLLHLLHQLGRFLETRFLGFNHFFESIHFGARIFFEAKASKIRIKILVSNLKGQMQRGVDKIMPKIEHAITFSLHSKLHWLSSARQRRMRLIHCLTIDCSSNTLFTSLQQRAGDGDGVFCDSVVFPSSGLVSVGGFCASVKLCDGFSRLGRHFFDGKNQDIKKS